MVDLTKPASLRKRFHELGAKAEAMRAKSAPLREKHDEMIAAHDAERRALEAKIRAAEKGLSDIDNERAALSRALGGLTGTPE